MLSSFADLSASFLYKALLACLILPLLLKAAIFNPVPVAPVMESHWLPSVECLDYPAVCFMKSRYFIGAIKAMVALGYFQAAKLLLPVRRIYLVSFQVVALLVCQLNVVRTIAPAR